MMIRRNRTRPDEESAPKGNWLSKSVIQEQQDHGTKTVLGDPPRVLREGGLGSDS
jgi:hypothetical protein